MILNCKVHIFWKYVKNYSFWIFRGKWPQKWRSSIIVKFIFSLLFSFKCFSKKSICEGMGTFRAFERLGFIHPENWLWLGSTMLFGSSSDALDWKFIPISFFKFFAIFNSDRLFLKKSLVNTWTSSFRRSSSDFNRLFINLRTLFKLFSLILLLLLLSFLNFCAFWIQKLYLIIIKLISISQFCFLIFLFLHILQYLRSKSTFL